MVGLGKHAMLLVQDVTGGPSLAGIRGGSRAVASGGVQIRLIVALDGQPVATGGELRGFIETISVQVTRSMRLRPATTNAWS
jgi:hypothetical protein